MESTVNMKGKKRISLLVLLLVVILAIGLVTIGCVSGLTPIGWSGGTVSSGTLFVGSNEGRLVAINLADGSRLWSDQLKAVSQPGLFGCSPAMGGGGCGAASAGMAIYGTPVVSGELAYMAGYNGKIFACNTNNLATRWVYPRDSYLPPIVGGLVVDRGKVFFGCSSGKIDNKEVNGPIFALDAVTGDKLWEIATGEKIWGTPAIDGDTLYIGSFDKKLYALNTADGSKKWEFVTEGAIISTPLVHNGTIFIGSFDRNLYAVNAIDGKLKWKFMGENWFWAEPAVFNDTIYAGCLDGNIYVLKAGSGEKVKSFEVKSPVSSQPVMVGSSIIFATRQGEIFKVDTSNNEIKLLTGLEKVLKHDVTVDGPLTAYEGIVYVHTQDGALQRIDAVKGWLNSVSLAKPN